MTNSESNGADPSNGWTEVLPNEYHRVPRANVLLAVYRPSDPDGPWVWKIDDELGRITVSEYPYGSWSEAAQGCDEAIGRIPALTLDGWCAELERIMGPTASAVSADERRGAFGNGTTPAKVAARHSASFMEILPPETRRRMRPTPAVLYKSVAAACDFPRWRAPAHSLVRHVLMSGAMGSLVNWLNANGYGGEPHPLPVQAYMRVLVAHGDFPEVVVDCEGNTVHGQNIRALEALEDELHAERGSLRYRPALDWPAGVLSNAALMAAMCAGAVKGCEYRHTRSGQLERERGIVDDDDIADVSRKVLEMVLAAANVGDRRPQRAYGRPDWFSAEAPLLARERWSGDEDYVKFENRARRAVHAGQRVELVWQLAELGRFRACHRAADAEFERIVGLRPE
jgi:hypothetical protein